MNYFENLVTLQCNSERVAFYMYLIQLFTTCNRPAVRDWGYLENWKSTASLI